jgi:hypothetical protein
LDLEPSNTEILGRLVAESEKAERIVGAFPRMLAVAKELAIDEDAHARAGYFDVKGVPLINRMHSGRPYPRLVIVFVAVTVSSRCDPPLIIHQDSDLEIP